MSKENKICHSICNVAVCADHDSDFVLNTYLIRNLLKCIECIHYQGLFPCIINHTYYSLPAYCTRKKATMAEM